LPQWFFFGDSYKVVVSWYNGGMMVLERKLILGLGFWLIILPLLGLPGSWKSGLTILTGIFIVYRVFKGGAKWLPPKTDKTAEKNSGAMFVENGDSSFVQGKLDAVKPDANATFQKN
jgi:hypothetical protein